jgi:RHS repeat-associated protein
MPGGRDTHALRRASSHGRLRSLARRADPSLNSPPTPDWGDQTFATTGWSAPLGFTGESTDPSQGLNHYYARIYDPSTGLWTAPDVWHGLIAKPQTLARFGYVTNNPTTFPDFMGYSIWDDLVNFGKTVVTTAVNIDSPRRGKSSGFP